MSKISYAVYPAVAVLALAAAFSTHAAPALDVNGEGYNPSITLSSNTTRAEVQAELARARANGELEHWAEHYQPVVALTSNRTRAEVRAEAIAARAAGYDAIYHEGYDPQYAAFYRSKASVSANVMASAPAKAPQ